MPRGAAEEDGLVYLSDPFIRRLVGPQVKLTERRRVLVYNHLRMIGHACLMFRTEHGRAPKSLAELVEAKCAPGVFGQGDLAHPDGGTYSLTADGMAGVCSKWGRADNLTPCLEHPVTTARPEEADEYRAFVREYNEYWRTFFDPIAVRVRCHRQAVPARNSDPAADRQLHLHDVGPGRRRPGRPARQPADPKARAGRGLGPPQQEAVHRSPRAGDRGQTGRPEGGSADLAGGSPRSSRSRRPTSSSRLGWPSTTTTNPRPLAGRHHRRRREADPELAGRTSCRTSNRRPCTSNCGSTSRGTASTTRRSRPTCHRCSAARPAGRGPTERPSTWPSPARTRPSRRTGQSSSSTTSRTACRTRSSPSRRTTRRPSPGRSRRTWPLTRSSRRRAWSGRAGQSFAALFGDGSVRPINYKVPPAELAAAFTRNGGEPAGNLVAAPDPKPRRPGGSKTPLVLGNDMKQIALAMHNYHDANGHFPPDAVPGPAGKAKLSWRVHLLPYLEQQELFNQFKLDEPWNSEHNKKLVEKMPDVFRGPNARLNEIGPNERGRPGRARHVFRADGAPVKLPDVADGTANTALLLRATDNAAVVWTKPDDLTVDPKDPWNGLSREDGFQIAMADGSVGRVRGGAEPATVLALFTRNGAEADAPAAVELNRPNGPRGPLFPLDFFPGAGDWSELESAGFDLNKLRRFLKDGIGDQVGFHMHDASKLLDYDVAGAFGGAEVMGQRLGGAEMFGLGMLVQFLTGPSSISIPVNDVKVVDEFLAELDKASVKVRAARGDTGWLREYLDFYRVPFPEPHVIRCHVVKFFGLKCRLYWGRIGNGLYVANRPFILTDLAAAHAAGKKPTGEKGHALFRLRPENWNEVLPGYKLGWAEGHRMACQDNLSQVANVNRGWNDRAGAALDAALLGRVAKVIRSPAVLPGRRDVHALGGRPDLFVQRPRDHAGAPPAGCPSRRRARLAGF